MDSTLLPTEPDENDVSLRILKAPSFVREVEATIDILQNWFTDKKRVLKPSHVLVVVPDIEKAAPVIEGVMASLPKDLFIPWKIIGLSEEKQNALADAFVGLGKLLMSDFSAREFFAWLEKLPRSAAVGLLFGRYLCHPNLALFRRVLCRNRSPAACSA